MTKEMRALLEKIEAKTAEAKSFSEGENKNISKAAEILEEVKGLQAEYEVQKGLYEVTKLKAPSEKELQKKKEVNSTEAFAKAVKGLVNKTMTEGVNEDGGYTVPEDVKTEILTYKEAGFSFEGYISNETVTTNKGSRTYQKKADVEGFSEVDEAGEIPEIGTPKFEKLNYTIKDKAGIIPVTKSLLNDSAANIKAVIVNWFGKNRIATINKNVITLLKSKAAVAITGLADIKKIVNVTLGSAYSGTVKIFTNDDGVNYLDTLEDKNGRPLLTPIPNEPKKMQLSIGGKVIEVVGIPNKVLASTDSKIPLIIGDLKEAIKRFDRQELEIMASDVASVKGFNAFSQNGVLMRGLMRDDYQKQDSDAFVYAELAVTA